MKRRALAAMTLAVLAVGSVAAQEPFPTSPEPTAEEIVARYVVARGGADRWRQVQALRAMGSYSAFSFKAGFTLIRRRGDHYRLDFELLQTPAVRARDASGAWALHKLLWPEPTRIDDSPYRPQFERESAFGPLLVEHQARGLAIESLGPGEIDGIATVALEVTFPDGQVETWHLDAETLLEVAVDSEVVDLTQGGPVRQRTYFDDFRPVEGLVLPHWLEHEFNHRLERMTIERWEVNPQLEPQAFSPPSED